MELFLIKLLILEFKQKSKWASFFSQDKQKSFQIEDSKDSSL